MAMNESQSEPSMEEILASIRRIIAEDEPAVAKDEILDLAEPVAEEAPEPEPEPAVISAPAHAASGADDLVFEDDVAVEEETYITAAPAPAPVAAPVMTTAAPATPREEALLSEAVASVTASALTRLASSMRIADDPNQTIEGMVRELLKPMLKDWLDANLPAIVDAKVEAALERVARLAR